MLEINGRGERIRTSDLTVPNRALYQAEPRPDVSRHEHLGALQAAFGITQHSSEMLADNREGR